MSLALEWCDTAEKQQRMLDILQFKLDILWSMLDAMTMAYSFIARPITPSPQTRCGTQGDWCNAHSGTPYSRLPPGLPPAVGSRSGLPCDPLPEGMAKLNDSATAILSEVDGIKSVGEIIATLEARFPDAEELAADVLDFLAQAYAQKWVIFRE